MDTTNEDRREALGHAVRHRLASEDAEDIVLNAETYLEFLRGEADVGPKRPDSQ